MCSKAGLRNVSFKERQETHLGIGRLSMLSHEEHAFKSVGEEEALDIEELGLGDGSADFRRLQVLGRELFSSTELGDERSASNQKIK